MNHDTLDEAKQRLRIPELWALLILPGAPAKSCHVPWREDKNPSGSVYADGLRFHDHATNEDFDAIDFLARARGLSLAVAIAEFKRLAGVTPPAADAPRRIVATYDYQGETGALLFQVVRFEPKTFRQRRPDATAPDGWTWKLDGVARVLYRLPEVLSAIQRGEKIILAEGEKDVAALVAQGFTATCNPGGAGKWLDDYTITLCGADVVIVADKDDAGRNHAQLVAGRLHGSAKSVRIAELPDFNGSPVKDAHDYFIVGATADDFRAVTEAAPLFAPLPDFHAAPPKNVSKPIITLPPEDEVDTANAPKPFPVDSLPPALASIVVAVARCERVPTALPAVCALGVASAAIGAGVEIVSGPDRVTRANLYLKASGESGCGKSQVFRRIAEPIIAHQHQLHESFREKTAPQLASEIGLLSREIKRLESKAARSEDPAERERMLGELEYKRARLAELEQKNAPPCVVCADVTSEKLAALLAANRETLFSASPEARQIVDIICGRYSATKSTDEAIYCCGWSGDFLRVDRLGRDPLTLRRPALSVVWLMQRDAMARLYETETLAQSGFLPRFLTCHTEAAPKKIVEGESQAISDAVRGQWTGLIADLLATYHSADKPFRIEPAPEAKRLLDDFFNSIVDRRAGELSDVGPFASRYGEQAWRVALVFHATLYGRVAHNHPLDAETAQSAMTVVQWFIDAQLAVLARGRRQAAEKLDEEVLELIESNRQRKGRDFTTAREVQQSHIVASAAAARTLLERMERAGLLSSEEIKPAGGGWTQRIYRAIGNPVPG